MKSDFIYFIFTLILVLCLYIGKDDEKNALDEDIVNQGFVREWNGLQQLR
jgi:hypothetical protein